MNIILDETEQDPPGKADPNLPKEEVNGMALQQVESSAYTKTRNNRLGVQQI